MRNVLGVPIHAIRMSAALDLCERAIEAESSLVIGVVNAAKLVKMRSDTLLQDSVLSSQLILADGMSVVWASRLLGEGLPERVTGIDLFEGLLARACARGHSVFFLGATQEVLDTMIEKLRAEHPELRVAGSRSGYFDDDSESDEVAGEIRASGADMLFVGITSPKKEIFLARYRGQLGVHVCHGVGGSFDVLAGKTERAPEAWQRFGVEWLYRLLQEPRRMWRRYLVTNTVFVALIAKEWLRMLLGSRGGSRAERGGPPT